ncbi:hypothetical protein GJ699_08575 [Duganella sp. FT80W]|uniref:Uncharacterized protein n=1 Tax=Duganella guangzhouensis TaxID=2666084 RepID=A0A6I2KZX6_9BURK|nr:hypothetical protein [Duganella guangzhouensis]MRW90034.1 hypothetical protein [Duganella guangzhouensis]
MSYDLMVFLPASAPADREEFMDWYDEQTEWDEGHSYHDPIVTAPSLSDLFKELVETFPAMNGPYAKSDLPTDETTLADYSIGKHVIYICFSWPKAEQAYAELHRLAAKHKVGFFDVSSDTGAVWLPNADGQLKIVHEQQE